jgi:isochorismate hydrolase
MPADQPHRSPALLNRSDSRLLIVDMQGKLLRVMPYAERVIAACELLARGATLMGIPISATEQYPQGLEPTVSELSKLVGACPEKKRFSSAGCLDWAAAVGDAERCKVVVAGIEAHVCVQQTVFDLLAAGFSVYIPADGVASRHDVDWTFALQRMRDSGAIVTTSEAILFEWLETADAEEFKEVSRLVKLRRPA